MIVLVLMAGAGSRFKASAARNKDYALPKPLVPVLGRPILEWTTRSLPMISHRGEPAPGALPDSSLHFAILGADERSHGLSQRLRALYGPGIKPAVFEEQTRGNLETAYVASEGFAQDESLLVLDSDNAYDGSALPGALAAIARRPAALICWFQPFDESPKWCFAMLRPDGTVSALREKSAEALRAGGKPMVGTFWFDSVRTFREAARKELESGRRTGAQGQGEFYMSQALARLVEEGTAVYGHEVRSVAPLGTPQDVETFIAHRV